MLAFDFAGNLHIGLGDGGGPNPDNAQDKNVLLGKILRINVDTPDNGALYSSTPGNPFIAVEGRDQNVSPSV